MFHDFEKDGFVLTPHVVGLHERSTLIEQLGPVDGAGRRRMLAIPAVVELAYSTSLIDLLRPHAARTPRPVRAIYFDKSPEANWLVAWHQDMTIAVGAQADIPGFGPWSVKQGVPHVQPPVGFLEQMLAVRLHLDDADQANGALRVLPGTHRLGRLSAVQIQSLQAERAEHVCVAGAGDVLLMRPLLLHASRRSTSGRPRRVLHIEYSGCNLPPGLEWHESA